MQTENLDQDIVEESLETIEEQSPAPTPGEVLQAERLRRDLTEKEVADKLHITMHYVRAIESNKFEKLPGAVFAKGYIKSYALLLELDVASVTALFDGINSEQQVKKEEANRREMARRRSDRNKPWVYASVACFVLGFAGLWAYNQLAPDDGTKQQVAPADAANSAAPPTIASRPIAQSPAVAAASVTSSTALPSSTTSEPTVSAPEQNAPVDSTSNPPENLVSVLSSLAAQAERNTAPLAQTETDATPKLDTAAAIDLDHVISVGDAGADVLRIRFSGESWVEVNDRNSMQIYRDIREAGDVLEITGDAPFTILLGDAPYTRMSLNGNEIDVSDNIRIDNSARLTVGL